MGGEGEQRLSNNKLNSYAVVYAVIVSSQVHFPTTRVPVLRECGVEDIGACTISYTAVSYKHATSLVYP